MMRPEPEIRKSIFVVVFPRWKKSLFNFVIAYGNTAMIARNAPPNRFSLSDVF
jgi:hypothetical protein